MSRKSIAVDIDDVIASFAEAFIELSNLEFGTKFNVEDYCDDYSKLWNLTQAEVADRLNELLRPERMLNLKVAEQAQQALSLLAARYDLYVMSARRKQTIEVTHEWLDRHFPRTFKGVHIVPIWDSEHKVTKAEVCRQIGADYLIDDLPVHCNLAAENGIKAILFGDYSWNRNEAIMPNVTRCKTWPDVCAELGVPFV